MYWFESEGKALSLGFFGLTWVIKGVYISYTFGQKWEKQNYGQQSSVGPGLRVLPLVKNSSLAAPTRERVIRPIRLEQNSQHVDIWERNRLP
jgi:hypothetical protein